MTRHIVLLITLTISQCVTVTQAKPLDLHLDSGDVLRVEVIAPQILRVRLRGDNAFAPSLMERYGIVRTDWPTCDYTVEETVGVNRIRTEAGTLVIHTQDGRMQLLNAQGLTICDRIVPQPVHWTETKLADFKARQASLAEYFKGEKRNDGQIQVIGSNAKDRPDYTDVMHSFDQPESSFGATFDIANSERFYGLGTASSRRLQLRGYGYRLWTQYRGNFGFNGNDKWEQTEGPIPFLMSTGGWGIFVNTSWVHYYDIGRYDQDKALFWGPGGELDFYLLIGDTLPKLIQQYVEITGKPRLLPKFGYGLTYVGHITQNEHEILNDSRLFREKGIPCDIMGLEPQWMKKFYDSSHDKEWNPDKFYMPSWMGLDSQSGTFIGGLARTGFKLSLWLVCADDMTLEEERQIAIREGQGESFSDKPEGWFNHLKKFVRNGARCFKMDPENLIQEHPHWTYANGRSDLENHNLTQVLYHKQMCQGFENFTKKRAMNHYCAAYAGVQHWGATTMGDNGGGNKALVWMLHYAMTGHMNTSCDMDTNDQGIHYGFLQPWSQHNNWAWARQPWFLGKHEQALFRDYARLRSTLIPYLYSAAHEGYRTSMPILRPMPLVYPDDLRLANCLTQYMLGDSLLVTVYTDKVTLPAGRWIDYWTGVEHQGPKEMPCTYPENRAGGLFIKAGAIIPYGPVMDFVDEVPTTTLTVHVYPKGTSDYTLYEDDGDTLAYIEGAVATTTMHCEVRAKQTVFRIDPRRGHYTSIPATRDYDVRIHTAPPQAVTVNGNTVDWHYDLDHRVVQLNAAEDGQRRTPIVISVVDGS